jgi:uncharacterized protein involved in exopolysaccharide biosynthesis
LDYTKEAPFSAEPLALDQDIRLGGAELRAGRERRIQQLRLVWGKRNILLRWTLSAALIATILAFALPKRYTATVQLLPPERKGGSAAILAAALGGGSSEALPAMAQNLFGTKTSGALFMGVLRSRAVEYSLVNQFDLRRVYGKRYWTDAAMSLESKTAIDQDRKTELITIKVTDRDPQRAAALAGAYVLALNRTLSDVSTSSAHRERQFLQQRLREVEQDLESAEREFSEFSSKNATIDIKEQGRAMVAASAELEGQLIAAESELRGLSEIYAPNNVRVRSLQARISELKRQIGRVSGQSPASGEGDATYPSIRQLPILGVTYADLYRRVKVQEAVFGTLTQQYEMAKVEEAREIPTVGVLDPPIVPEKRSFPPRKLIMILLPLFTLIVGVVCILTQDLWNSVPASDPRRGLANEVANDLRTDLPWLRTSRLRLRRTLPRSKRNSTDHSDETGGEY